MGDICSLLISRNSLCRLDINTVSFVANVSFQLITGLISLLIVFLLYRSFKFGCNQTSAVFSYGFWILCCLKKCLPPALISSWLRSHQTLMQAPGKFLCTYQHNNLPLPVSFVYLIPPTLPLGSLTVPLRLSSNVASSRKPSLLNPIPLWLLLCLSGLFAHLRWLVGCSLFRTVLLSSIR